MSGNQKKIIKYVIIILLLLLYLRHQHGYVLPNQQAQSSELTEITDVDSNNDSIADTSSSDLNAVDLYYNGALIPKFDGSPYVVVNGNMPYFTDDELTTDVFEIYTDLDELGRCGQAYANICTELMPTEKRESIGSVKPSGWHNKKYDFVDGLYLYNRCHLIGFQLAGENANPLNLITGTRYLNVQGMLPFENMVADYVKETNNHVLYRVTPVFYQDELVARGVVMEAEDVEEHGEDICFSVFVYNYQPGVTINYATGDNWLTEE